MRLTFATLAFIGQMMAYARAPIGKVTTVKNSENLLTFVIAAILLSEAITRLQIMCVVVGMGGVAVVCMSSHPSTNEVYPHLWVGLAWAAAAAVGAALAVIAIRLMN